MGKDQIAALLRHLAIQVEQESVPLAPWNIRVLAAVHDRLQEMEERAACEKKTTR